MTISTFVKLSLLILAGVAAIVLGASAASANTAVEVDREAGGSNCNPCVIEVAGESHINAFGVRISTCSDLYTAEIYHNGTGRISYINTEHDSGGTCTRIACNGVGEPLAEREFDIHSMEETASKIGELNVRFCLDAASNPNRTGTHCTAPVRFIETTSHDYVFNMHSRCVGDILEVEGNWSEVDGDDIEIVHIH